MHNLCFSSFCKICWRFIYWQSTFLMLLFSIGTSFLCFSNRFSVFVCVIVFTCTLKRLFFFLCASPKSTKWRNKIWIFHGFYFFNNYFFRCFLCWGHSSKIVLVLLYAWGKNAMNCKYFAQCKVLHVSFLSTSWCFAAYIPINAIIRKKKKKINIEVECQ